MPTNTNSPYFRLQNQIKTHKMHFFLKKVVKNLHSSKSRCTFASLFRQKHGCLAQLVQSICLTSRGSAVRIRQHPRREMVVSSSGLGRWPLTPETGVRLPVPLQSQAVHHHSELLFYYYNHSHERLSQAQSPRQRCLHS